MGLSLPRCSATQLAALTAASDAGLCPPTLPRPPTQPRPPRTGPLP